MKDQGIKTVFLASAVETYHSPYLTLISQRLNSGLVWPCSSGPKRDSRAWWISALFIKDCLFSRQLNCCDNLNIFPRCHIFFAKHLKIAKIEAWSYFPFFVQICLVLILIFFLEWQRKYINFKFKFVYFMIWKTFS